jgi:hypothetical protein
MIKTTPINLYELKLSPKKRLDKIKIKTKPTLVNGYALLIGSLDKAAIQVIPDIKVQKKQKSIIGSSNICVSKK